MDSKYKLVFFVPQANLKPCQAAIFATGAGTYDKYTEVCFVSPGVGQFRPAADAQPFIGSPGDLEQVQEVRCEILCNGREQTQKAVAELKR